LFDAAYFNAQPRSAAMDKARLIERLNEAISLELTGLLQYNQYAQVITGVDRKIWQGFFKDAADEGLEHARKFAARVTALGGTPSVEPGVVIETTQLQEMLQNSLDHERHAVDLYTMALDVCADNAAYRNLLEDQILTETNDVEELEKYLGQVHRMPGHRAHRRAPRPAVPANGSSRTPPVSTPH
jgi:bacterioferritin